MADRLHIALYTENSRVGGAERYVVDLAQELAARQHRVTVVTHEGPVASFFREEAAAADTVALPPIRPPGSFTTNVQRLIKPAIDIRRTLARLGPDVVHVSNGGYPGSDYCRTAVLMSRAPTVMTVHATPSARAATRERAHRLFDARVWAGVDLCMCATEFVADALVDLRGLSSERVRVVPYGVRDPQVNPSEVARIRAQLDADRSLVLGIVSSPGSNEQWKGYPVLADALDALDSSVPVAVALVGHDPGAAFEERCAQAPAVSTVLRTGPVRDPLGYIAALDALCVPSTKYESLPLTILEAMALGAPAIASRIAGIPEAIEDGVQGLLFAPGDSVALASRIARAATNRAELADMGNAARARFEARFRLERMIAGVVAVYRDASAKSQRSL